jgi:hypothetical protein
VQGKRASLCAINHTSDGLVLVGGAREGHAAVGVGHHLVGDHDRDAELIGEALQLTQVAREDLLALAELAAAREVGAKQRRRRVHDQQRVSDVQAQAANERSH